MLYSLRGTLVAAGPGYAVIECGGVGYRCAVSLQTLSGLPSPGAEARLYTQLQVREDAVELFGFCDERELECFRQLISVNGVGAKAALALLSEFSTDRLVLTVASGDAKALTRAAGVGGKLAGRIVLELKDKLGGMASAAGQAAAPAAGPVTRGSLGEALEALAALGYSQSEAALALAGAPEDAPAGELVRSALKKLSGFR